MKIITLEGTPRSMGRAFGEELRAEIAEFYELRVANAIRQAKKYGGRIVDRDDVTRAARACVAPTAAYHRAGFEELCGIAEGADMPVEQILATNGLTDIRDILCWPGQLDAFGGCSSYIVAGDRTADGAAYCGQTWDLATDNLPYVLSVHRRPSDGPQTWSLTTVGCLSLIGLNEHGLAIGTTNVRSMDARPGVTYLSIIHKVLAQRSFDDGARAIVDAHRAGAHFYYLLGPGGDAAAFECRAEVAHRQDVPSGAYVHTNHCLVPANQATEGVKASSSSLKRQARLEDLTGPTDGGHSVAALQAMLGDTDNGTDAICRDDFDGINTNGAVVMAPDAGNIWVHHGLPTPSGWIDLKAATS